jgi:hypothetical protein
MLCDAAGLAGRADAPVARFAGFASFGRLRGFLSLISPTFKSEIWGTHVLCHCGVVAHGPTPGAWVPILIA